MIEYGEAGLSSLCKHTTNAHPDCAVDAPALVVASMEGKKLPSTQILHVGTPTGRLDGEGTAVAMASLASSLRK